MLDMIALILGEDQDVVKVNKNKPIDHVLEATPLTSAWKTAEEEEGQTA